MSGGILGWFAPPIKQSLGHFDFKQNSAVFRENPESDASIQVSNVENALFNVVKTLKVGKFSAQCRLTIIPNSSRQFENLVIYDDKIKVFYSDSPEPEVFDLPNDSGNYVNEFKDFVDAKGWITVDDNPLNTVVNGFHEKGESQLKAIGKEIFIECFDTSLSILSFDKDIRAISHNLVIFKDGTVEKLNTSLHNNLYFNRIIEAIRLRHSEARKAFLSEIENIDPNLRTPDDHNVQRLFSDIDLYFRNGWNSKSLKEQSEEIKTYETLTQMLKQSKQPEGVREIEEQMQKIKTDLEVAKNLAHAILLFIAAGALIGLGVVCLTVLAVLTAGATAGASALLFIAALPTLIYAVHKLVRFMIGYEHNKNVKRVTDFFDSKQALVPREISHGNNSSEESRNTDTQSISDDITPLTTSEV